MKQFSTYSVQVKNKEYTRVFEDTARKYRQAVNFFISVCLKEEALFSALQNDFDKLKLMEQITVATDAHPVPKYDFNQQFYKFPCYYRRAAIAEVLGKVSSYRSNLKNWRVNKVGKKPSIPKAGFVYPSLYKDNTFVRTDTYNAKVKVWIRNTWDWITVNLDKSDVNYITRYCAKYKEHIPTLQKRGKLWYLDFAFSEVIALNNKPIERQTVLAVDLGINNACTCVAMKYDGTVLGRRFFKTPREKDCLNHAINKIKQAQQHGAKHMPRLWARANGINDRIAILTANYIMNAALEFNVTTIVFEHLELQGKKHGSKKQRLALWKAQYVQAMVTNKAHRHMIRIAHVNAANTSKLAFDGSGKVKRGDDANLKSYGLCKFKSGKIYNCDLNACYNIGSRYFIREIYKSLPATVGLSIAAKVPQCLKRNTCTLSTLISFNAELKALSA